MTTGILGVVKRRRAFGWLIIAGLSCWSLVAAALAYDASFYRTDSEGTYRIDSK